MVVDYYAKLPQCLKRYVEGHKWTDFRDVQKESFKILFDTENHLLISSGTSSGKTEAALFPVITDIYRRKPKRISALYVSPLIALIDDQKDRVSMMLRDSEIHLYPWHGGISSSTKRKVIENGEGILQITPESLENLVNKNYSKIEGMFSDLRYIIIDEVHTFMNSDRGLHLLCELGIIERIAGCHPRRIGLSATLSDYEIAKTWLKADTDRDVSLVECKTDARYDLTITYDCLAPKGSPTRQKSLREFYTRLFEATNDYNCLVFANNRTSVENTVISLKKINREEGVKKDVWAHHSSISKEYRTLAEERMKDPDFRCTGVATSTLELGVDIGDLDRVIHINAPQNVSSFVQKFGRSGRRDGHPTMMIFCNNNRNPDELLNGIATDLIKAIAEAELFFEHHWIEPVRYSRLPYSLLFQQTVSYIRSRYTATSDELLNNVLGLYPFKEIPESDYRLILDYMCECKVLDYNSYHKTYSLDAIGDVISRDRDFVSNFVTIREFDVFDGRKKIGSIQSIPSIGEIVQLAGSSWEVIAIDSKMKQVMVKQSEKNTETFWKSGRVDIQTELMRQMYECLCDDKEYPWLDKNAEDTLTKCRKAFRAGGLDSFIVDTEKSRYLLPWLGTVQFDTLFRILAKAGIANTCMPPYGMIVKAGTTLEDVEVALTDFIKNGDPMQLVDDQDVLFSHNIGKYNRYIPLDLLKKQFVQDRIDLDICLLDRTRQIENLPQLPILDEILSTNRLFIT